MKEGAYFVGTYRGCTGPMTAYCERQDVSYLLSSFFLLLLVWLGPDRLPLGALLLPWGTEAQFKTGSGAQNLLSCATVKNVKNIVKP